MGFVRGQLPLVVTGFLKALDHLVQGFRQLVQLVPGEPRPGEIGDQVLKQIHGVIHVHFYHLDFVIAHCNNLVNRIIAKSNNLHLLQ